MPTVTLATTLAKWLPGHAGGELSLRVSGGTVRETLEQIFIVYPLLRGYVLEDQGALRHHVAVFVDGVAVGDKQTLQQPVTAQSEIFIAQALSGG
jgi:sulfur carrier protein ThiS